MVIVTVIAIAVPLVISAALVQQVRSILEVEEAVAATAEPVVGAVIAAEAAEGIAKIAMR